MVKEERFEILIKKTIVVNLILLNSLVHGLQSVLFAITLNYAMLHGCYVVSSFHLFLAFS